MELLQSVLQLWTGARTLEGGWRICGTKTLDLTPNARGIIPLTSASIIDYQFASVLVQRILLPLNAKALRDLQRLVLGRDKGNWLIVFLSTFILLHSYTTLMKQQRKFAMKRNAKVKRT